MHFRSSLLLVTLLTSSPLFAGVLQLSQPRDYQVIQRNAANRGDVLIQGTADVDLKTVVFQVRISEKGIWQPWTPEITKDGFSGHLEVPAGGWHRLEVRVMKKDQVLSTAAVEHVGIGEVFVVAGQSNSANHGQEKQNTQTQRVVAFDGQRWQLANDPQPGASGRGGSFMPPLGDALVKRFDVPIGFIACGLGGSSVREWLPKGSTFPNPPTVERRVERQPDGRWASDGAAYDALVARMKAAGRQGFRAVLWHQGESDANQKDTTRTLAGKLYREYLEKLIRDSRRDIGWNPPWFVAQVSYHVPGDEASPDIRAAQASLWQDGIALAGPDSDALKGDFRERDGQGVHFSGKGLHAHAAAWAEKVLPWIEQQLLTPR